MAKVIELQDRFKILVKNTVVEVMTISSYNKSRGMMSNSSYISVKDCIGKVKVKQSLDKRMEYFTLIVVDAKYSYLNVEVEQLKIVHDGNVYSVEHESEFAKHHGVSRQRVSYMVNHEDKIDVIKFPHGQKTKNLIIKNVKQYEPKEAELAVVVG